ncbi:MAG: thioesterase family protein [Desulfobacteraceae bacterium]|nr:MAG: thioesterase family protein [Desulfobacteraceae bacterium]
MHLFDQDVSLSLPSPDGFKTQVTKNWSINGNPNGGYLMALVANAMRECSEKKALLISTATYLSRCLPGNGDIFVENIGLSKNFDRWQAKLLQDGREIVRAMGTFMDAPIDPLEKRYEKPAPELAAVEDCIQIPPMGTYTLYDGMDVRLDPRCAGWFQGSLVDISEHKGWIRFQNDRPWDALAILLAADSFPPPVFASQGMTAWVPTIEFSVNIRNIPTTRWLKCIFRSHFIHNNILEEDGEIWDENNELVAISRQIAQFRKK